VAPGGQVLGGGTPESRCGSGDQDDSLHASTVATRTAAHQGQKTRFNHAMTSGGESSPGIGPRRMLAALRLVVGTVSYASPRLAARAFAIDADESEAMPSAIRLFGARELVLGIGILGPDGASPRWLALGAAADALDLVTVGLGVRARRLGPATAVIGGAMAVLAVGLGLAALRE
jgi:hypothetical protein